MKDLYKKHKFSTLINITKIVTAHYFEFDKDYKFGGERHDFWEMVYADRGKFLVTAGGKEITLNQGEAYFHKPNEFHTLYSDGINAPNIFVISFVCTSRAMDFFKKKKFTVSIKNRQYISRIVQECQQTFDTPLNDPEKNELRLLQNGITGGEQMIKTSLEQFLIMLIRSCEQTGEKHLFPTDEISENVIVSSVLDILEKNIYNKVTVSEICASLGYSKAYISRLFSASTGYSMLECYTKLKINEAKKLIREKRYNFAQISDLLKFDTPQYFTRVFKKHTNMTPSQYYKSVCK